tara:strand:- start:492 stop:2072 length:1581 start_codon:yes stop_codon:yes gene_type:complete
MSKTTVKITEKMEQRSRERALFVFLNEKVDLDEVSINWFEKLPVIGKAFSKEKAQDQRAGAEDVPDISLNKVNIPLPIPDEKKADILKDPEVQKVLKAFYGRFNVQSDSAKADFEKAVELDPDSTLRKYIAFAGVDNVATKEKEKTVDPPGLSQDAPISLFSGLDDDKKDNFGNRLRQSLKTRKKQGVSNADIEKVVMSILKDLEGQLEANDLVVRESFDVDEAKKGSAQRKKIDKRKQQKLARRKARKAKGKRATGDQRNKIKKRTVPTPPDGIQGLKSPQGYEPDAKARGDRDSLLGTNTTPQKGAVQVGKAIAGKVLKSQILGDLQDKEERQNAQKQITKIITRLARPWFKKHITARGQIKNIRLKEELELFENTLFNILFQENLTINNLSETDMDDLINEINKFYPYAQEYMGFDQPISLNLISDPDNAKDTFGKTAYYSPAEKQMAIFVDGRHPKDIIRSFSHELVHHAQNCRGEFDREFNVGENYIETDDHLREMEREAYEKGNMCLRHYESYLKKENKK